MAMFGFSHTALSLACLSVKPRSRNLPATCSSASLSVLTGPPPWVFIATRPMPEPTQAATASFIFGVSMRRKL